MIKRVSKKINHVTDQIVKIPSVDIEEKHVLTNTPIELLEVLDNDKTNDIFFSY